MGLLLAEHGQPLLLAERFTSSIAGAESNVAVGLARLGWSAEFVGRVGDDVIGERIRRALRAEGVGVDHLSTDASRPTGVLIRDVMSDRPIDVVYHRTGSAGSSIDPDDVRDELFERATVFHTTGLTAMLSPTANRTVAAALGSARRHHTITSLDVNLRTRLGSIDEWRAGVRPLLPLVDIVFVGREEIGVIADATSTDEAIAELHAAGVRLVVVKLGADGAVVSDGSRQRRVAAHPVDVVDPVGAGDAFAVGVLSSVLAAGGIDAVDLDVAMRRGAACAALVLGVVGDMTGLPDEATLRSKLDDDTETRR